MRLWSRKKEPLPVVEPVEEAPPVLWHPVGREEWRVTAEYPAAGYVEETLCEEMVDLHSGTVEWHPKRDYLSGFSHYWPVYQTRIVRRPDEPA